MSDPHTSDPSPRPFIAAPHASRYFPAAIFEESRQRITRSIERGEGPALLIGAAGTGKTMLVEVLTEQFRDAQCIVPLAGSQLCTRRALLQMVLFQIGLPYRGLDEGELRLSLLSHLRPAGTPARRLLLLVDEAESLPDRLLEELRVLTNIADAGQLLVSLVLVGSASLEERFADPKLEVFSQRISSRSYLAPLGREETLQYIRAQVATVGLDPLTVFTDEGLESMFAVTDGVPRLINQLGDQLFWMAHETGYAPLDAEIVQQAWSELQQLPAPWNTPEVEPTGSDVQFGQLESYEAEIGKAEDISHEESESEDFGHHKLEDDMPASIPMSLPQRAEQQSLGTGAPITDAFNATEDLLAQLNQMEQDGCVSEPTVASTMPPASTTPVNNPFLEEFDSEECLLDQYSEFESQLLSSAPKVVNRYDTFFAEQLQQFEITETATMTLDEDAKLQSLRTEPSEAKGETEDPQEIPGALLVVEDEAVEKIEVVPGKQFRQLFSSLQSDAESPCLG